MLGLELRTSSVVAVSTDAAGGVTARAERPWGADAGRAALEALAQVAGSASQSPLGVAAVAPQSDAVRSALAALADRFTGRFAKDGAAASGTAGALAELAFGAARGSRHVVYFAVGEHASAGVLCAGVPLVGAHRRAPAASWLALNPVEREDYRRAGCLEAEVASAGVVRRIVWRIKAGDGSSVQQMVNGDLSAITLDHVLTAARQRDGVAVSVVRDTAKYLGMAAANLVAITDPERLVVGGMMASAADLLLEPLRVEIARRLPAVMMESLTIVPAALGDDAPAIGAAHQAGVALP